MGYRLAACSLARSFAACCCHQCTHYAAAPPTDSGTTDLFDVQHKSATTIISDIAMTRHMKDAKATKDTLSPTAPLDPTDPVQRYLLGRMSARTRRKLMSGYGLDPNTI